MHRSAALVRVALLVAVVAGAVVACDTTDSPPDDGSAAEATLSQPETLPPLLLDATIPDGTPPDEAVSSVDDVLADGTVTAEELAGAYGAYVACLADGGGSGRYAYDIDLRTGLAIDWAIDESTDIDRDELAADCSSRYLGGLTREFERNNPVGDDLAGRQRASIAACIETVSPEAAANLPAEIAFGTAGEASSVGELQLDPAALDPQSLGADPEDAAAVGACIASLGVEWQTFG